jgi:hypothetical protein
MPGYLKTPENPELFIGFELKYCHCVLPEPKTLIKIIPNKSCKS